MTSKSKYLTKPLFNILLLNLTLPILLVGSNLDLPDTKVLSNNINNIRSLINSYAINDDVHNYFKSISGLNSIPSDKKNSETKDNLELALSQKYYDDINEPNKLIKYGYQLLLANKTESAKKFFIRVLDIKPQNNDALLGLALSFNIEGDLKSFRSYRNKILTVKNAIDISHYLILAEIALSNTNYSEAIDYCEKVLKDNIESYQLDQIAAKCYYELGRLKNAEKFSIKILNVDPENNEFLLQLVNIYKTNQSYDKALTIIDQSLKKNHENLVYHKQKFEILALQKRYQDAEKYLENNLSTVSKLEFAELNAFLKNIQGYSLEALKILEPHLDESKATISWAKIKIANGDVDTAINAINRVHLNFEQWKSISSFAKEKGDYIATISLLEMALKQHPSNPHLLNSWAWTALETGAVNIQPILYSSKRAYDALPENPKIIDTYSEALLSARQYRECRNILTSNEFVIKNNPQLLFTLAYSFELLSQNKSALKNYTDCLNLLENSNEWSLRQTKEELVERIHSLKGSQS